MITKNFMYSINNPTRAELTKINRFISNMISKAIKGETHIVKVNRFSIIGNTILINVTYMPIATDMKGCIKGGICKGLGAGRIA